LNKKRRRKSKFKIEVADNKKCKWIQMRRKVHSLWRLRNSCKMVKKVASLQDNSRMKLLVELD
jgi:hypothetical protein